MRVLHVCLSTISFLLTLLLLYSALGCGGRPWISGSFLATMPSQSVLFSSTKSPARTVTPSSTFRSFISTPLSGRKAVLTSDSTAGVAVLAQGTVFILSGVAECTIDGTQCLVGHRDNSFGGQVHAVSCPLEDVSKAAVVALPGDLADWSVFSAAQVASAAFGVDVASADDADKLHVASTDRLGTVTKAVPMPFGHGLVTSSVHNAGFRSSFAALSPEHKVWMMGAYRSTLAPADGADPALAYGPLPEEVFLTGSGNVKQGGRFPTIRKTAITTVGMEVDLSPVAPPLFPDPQSPSRW